MGNAIEVIDAVKVYPLGGTEVVAVDKISLEICDGEFVAIVGRSGSGKTTLLNMLAGIDRPTSGTVRAAGVDLGGLSEAGLAAWRGAVRAGPRRGLGLLRRQRAHLRGWQRSRR